MSSAPAVSTQIITDQESGSVTIVIEGEPMLLVDKTGLHVVGDVTYGGTIRDAGEDVKTIIEEHNVYGGTDEE